jgi:hypothetical protein
MSQRQQPRLLPLKLHLNLGQCSDASGRLSANVPTIPRETCAYFFILGFFVIRRQGLSTLPMLPITRYLKVLRASIAIHPMARQGLSITDMSWVSFTVQATGLANDDVEIHATSSRTEYTSLRGL